MSIQTKNLKNLHKPKFFKMFWILSISLTASFWPILNAYATSYQIFTSYAYSNPAALNSVKKQEAILGGALGFPEFVYKGTVDGVPGTASSRTTDFLPYARFAMRFSPKIVASFDITQPYFTDIRYPADSIVSGFVTDSIFRDFNYSPKISYQATSNLAVGLGFDANNLYDAQSNFVVPPFGVVKNKLDGWAYGFDAGLFYHATCISPGTFLGLSFYSKIIQHLHGKSEWGPFTNDDLKLKVTLPATYLANLIQQLTMKWAIAATIRYTDWSPVRFSVLQNSVFGNIITPLFFFDNFSAQLVNTYQINDKWGMLAAFDYEPNMQPTRTRSVVLPSYTRYTFGLGAQYQIIKSLKAQLIYYYIYSKPPIEMTTVFGSRYNGTERLRANAIDLSLKYDI